LNRAEDGKYVKFVKNAVPRDFVGSLAPIVAKKLASMHLKKGTRLKETRADNVPGFTRMLNRFDWKTESGAGPRPLFAREITGTTEEAATRGESRFSRKQAMIVSNISVMDFLKTLCGFIKGSYETTFWGAVVFPDRRGGGKIRRGRLGRVLKQRGSSLLVQLVDDPGRIVVVSSKMCVEVEVSTESSE
jgi:hypothetical protein